LLHFVCTECHFFTAVEEKIRTHVRVSVSLEKAKLPFDFVFGYSKLQVNPWGCAGGTALPCTPATWRAPRPVPPCASQAGADPAWDGRCPAVPISRLPVSPRLHIQQLMNRWISGGERRVC